MQMDLHQCPWGLLGSSIIISPIAVHVQWIGSQSCLGLVSISYGAFNSKLSLDRISNCLVGLLSHLRWMLYRDDCHPHIEDAVWNRLEWPLLRGDVYSVKCSGPSTEPWRDTKGEAEPSGGRTSSSLIHWLLPIKYEDTQFIAWPDIPNQFYNLPKNMVWSLISKAADKSYKVRAVTLPLSIAVKISLWMWRSAVWVDASSCKLIHGVVLNEQN